jgi:hypothetical protein
MVAAFLCKIARDKLSCPRSTDFLLSKTKDSELADFIRRQDDGGLLYPKDQLIGLVVATVKLFEEHWPTISAWRKPATTLHASLITPIRSSNIISCGCENVVHTHKLQDLLLKHLIKIILQNKCNSITEREDKPNFRNKPSSRKVLKLS